MSRLSLGVLAGLFYGALSAASMLPLPGVLLSAADAVITKAYAPILVLGAVGGAVIGWVIGRFGG
jgi:hypothetical protein